MRNRNKVWVVSLIESYLRLEAEMLIARLKLPVLSIACAHRDKIRVLLLHSNDSPSAPVKHFAALTSSPLFLFPSQL